MANAAQATVFLGALVGLLRLFGIFPGQPNAKQAAQALFHLLTVVLLLAALAAGRFLNPAVGVIALLSAVALVVAPALLDRNADPKLDAPLTAAYVVLELLTLVLVLGAIGIGIFQ